MQPRLLQLLLLKNLKKKKIDIIPYLKIVKLNGTIDLNPFKIEFVTLTHSIIEPNGLKIDTPAGTIFHTGDWKVDPNPLVGKNINQEKLKQIGDNGVLAMICDSTNVFSIGRAVPKPNLRKILFNFIYCKKKKY